MASYQIEWKNSAKVELKKLDKPVIPRILKAVEELASNPYPDGFRKLRGVDHTYRIRVGNYRIVYEVYNNILTVQIVRVRHRKEVYQ